MAARGAERRGGALLASSRVATDRHHGPDGVIDQIAHLVAKVRRPDTVAMGVGVPCAVDGPRGIVRDIPALPGWVDVPLAGLLQRRIGLPVAIENDAKAATIAEWRHGAAQGETDFVYVTVSTGIGAGAVIGGRLGRRTGAHPDCRRYATLFMRTDWLLAGAGVGHRTRAARGRPSSG